MKKQVLRTFPKPTIQPISVTQTNIDNFYGVETCIGDRGFITTQNYYEKFTVRSPIGLTRGNGWNQILSDDFTDLVEKCFDKGWEVFQFDTFMELAQWLDKGE